MNMGNMNIAITIKAIRPPTIHKTTSIVYLPRI